MSFRTVVIKERAKLDLRMNYLVYRGSEEKQIFLPEISVLILESTSISLTSALISELVKNNVKIIFCDEKHNPESEVVAYHSNYQSYKKIKEQLSWTQSSKAHVWQQIIKQKILTELYILKQNNFVKECELITPYVNEIMPGDTTNREGLSAKIYFNALFGENFQRRNQSFINSALNYGYSILLSMFNREVTKNGYLTQIGIWHKNDYNYFNLSSDLMEPFRAIVDKIVLSLKPEDYDNYKYKLLDMVNIKLKINNKEQYLENAISIYCLSVFDSLKNDDISQIKFYEL